MLENKEGGAKQFSTSKEKGGVNKFQTIFRKNSVDASIFQTTRHSIYERSLKLSKT